MSSFIKSQSSGIAGDASPRSDNELLLRQLHQVGIGLSSLPDESLQDPVHQHPAFQCTHILLFLSR